jgi:hypothetical protein
MSLELNTLKGQQVFVRQGDGGESSSYFSGKITGVTTNKEGILTNIQLDDKTTIPYDSSITTISLISANSN